MAIDQYRSYVVLHLPMENNLLDSTGRAVTAVGAVGLSSANNPAPYGTACAQFGTNTYLQYAASADWYLGTLNYTIEFWMRLTAADLSGVRTLVKQAAGTSQFWGLYYGRLCHSSSGSWYVVNEGTTFVAGTGYHIAFCRAGSILRVFVNGVLDQTISSYTVALPDSPAVLTIGGDAAGNNQHFYGTLKDVRITKGYARYTAAFAPPSTLLPLGGSIAGVIRDASNAPLAGATVRAYDRSNGALVSYATTGADGGYTLSAGNGLHYVVALDPAGVANALIADLVAGVAE